MKAKEDWKPGKVLDYRGGKKPGYDIGRCGF